MKLAATFDVPASAEANRVCTGVAGCMRQTLQSPTTIATMAAAAA